MRNTNASGMPGSHVNRACAFALCRQYEYETAMATLAAAVPASEWAVWIGLSDTLSEQTWAWSNGVALQYTRWSPTWKQQDGKDCGAVKVRACPCMLAWGISWRDDAHNLQ